MPRSNTISLATRLVRNSVSTLGRVVVMTLIGLILPPFIIAYLGLGQFGVWSLVLLLNSYVIFLDFGLQSGLIKFVADAYVQKDTDEVNRLVNIALTLMGTVFIVGSTFAIMSAHTLARFLFADMFVESFAGIVQIYLIVALGNLLVIPYSSLLKGLHRYDQCNALEVGAALLNAVIVVLGLVGGLGLDSLLIGAASALGFRLIGYIWLARNTFSAMCYQIPAREDITIIKRLMYLSPADLSTRAYTAATQTIVRFSLLLAGGLFAVGAYEMAKRVVSQVCGLSATLFTPLLPAVSALASSGQTERLERLLDVSLRYLSMVAIPMLFFLLLLYDPLLQAWLKTDDISAISLAGRFLLIAVTLDLFTGPVTTASVGMGTVRITLLKLFFPISLYLSLVPLMGWAYGYIGILIGETLAIIAGTVAGLLLFDRWSRIHVCKMALSSGFRSTMIAFPVALSFFLFWYVTSTSSWWDSLLIWGAYLGCFLALTGYLFYWSGLLRTEDIDRFITAFQRTKSATDSS